jgi:hypothetical protein
VCIKLLNPSGAFSEACMLTGNQNKYKTEHS